MTQPGFPQTPDSPVEPARTDGQQSWLDAMKAFDARRPDLPGEHLVVLGLGVALLLSSGRSRSILGRRRGSRRRKGSGMVTADSSSSSAKTGQAPVACARAGSSRTARKTCSSVVRKAMGARGMAGGRHFAAPQQTAHVGKPAVLAEAGNKKR